MSINSIWTKGFIELGDKYVGWYADGKFELDFMVKNISIREALVEVYNVLVGNKILVPIEELTEVQKSEVWNDCKPFIVSLKTPDRIKFCKGYWALSYLAKKKYDL